MKSKFLKVLAITTGMLLTSCGESISLPSSIPTSVDPTTSETPSSSVSSSSSLDDVDDGYISVTDALDLISDVEGWEATERVYVKGVIKTVSKPEYGEMTITDGTNELYVYGTYGADGVARYSELEEKPNAGDTVYLSALFSNFKGTKQIKSGWIQKFDKKEINESDYVAKTVAEAREANKGDLVKVSGVVASITHANGGGEDGVFLVDQTGSIYVYDKVIASSVTVGNTITVIGEKDFFVAESEATNAAKWGYKGACQIANARMLTNDNGNTEFSKASVEETTVKNIMASKAGDNITGKIYKVNALVKKAPGSGFVNYYIDDLDGVTGSYVYTKCNGSDFSWLDEFDGKICTVYLSVINAKSTTDGILWRFHPVAVYDENYVFDKNDATKFAIEYYALDQFEKSYKANPQKEVITSVSSELLGFENLSLAYTSSNTSVAFFTETDGKLVFETGEPGQAKITISATLEGYASHQVEVDVVVEEPVVINGISVKEAIDKPVDQNTKLLVKGIVGPSLVNQVGFYLIDETGVIAVRTDKENMTQVSLGDYVSIECVRDKWTKDKDYGQNCISNAVIKGNAYGNHEYSTASFIKGKTLADLVALDVVDDSVTSNVYEIEAEIQFEKSAYYSNAKIVDGDTYGLLYTSSATQYSWLEDYADGTKYKMEIAPCNWNSKKPYKFCILSITDASGNKIFNTYNFTK